MFLMNKTKQTTCATDGRNSCYIVKGEDSKTYGAFLVSQEAKYFKEQLEARFEAQFEIITYSLGPSCFFSGLMEGYDHEDNK